MEKAVKFCILLWEKASESVQKLKTSYVSSSSFARGPFAFKIVKRQLMINLVLDDCQLPEKTKMSKKSTSSCVKIDNEQLRNSESCLE